MKYAIVGGDMRSVRLAENLAADGHTVRCFAMEKAAIRGDVKCPSLSACLRGADGVLLPIPAEKDAFLNAPFSEEKIKIKELISCLVPGQKLFGGGLDDTLVSPALSGGIEVFDLLKEESFVSFNALLTAEAAVGLLIHDCDRAILYSRALVLGYGKIARALAERLKALGSEASVAARSEAARKEAESAGLHTISLTALENGLGGFDFIINTIPGRILSDAALRSADENAVFMELASAPGGFDEAFAKAIGLKTISAPGLPGKFSPRSAAQAIQQTVYSAFQAGKE